MKEIIGECEKVLVQHRRYSPENLLDDDLFRTLVQEMLSTKAMARSKFQLYIEEPSRYLAAVKNMPMRDAHRERMASMHRRFEILSGTEESDQEKTRNEALLLCKAEGLVKESINEQNEQQESKMMEAAGDDWKPSHIRLLKAAGADVNENLTDGTTPTIKAAMCGHTATVKELHSLGADLFASDDDGKTAAIYASKGGHTETEDANLLALETGA